MSKIKSALELALERTAGVEVDKEAVRKDEYTRKGKSAAGKYLGNPKSLSLSEKVETLKGDEQIWFRNGVIETLLANLTLPRYESDLSRFPPIADALKSLAKKKGAEAENLTYLLGQYDELFKQYLQNVLQLEEQLKTQWEPRLRQKEQQLKQQTGQAVRLTPEQDPEFAKVLTDELARLDAQYAEILSKGKEEIRKLV
jgi:predicted phage-related endonuclease